MDDWQLPDVPSEQVSIHQLIRDKKSRPADYERVSGLIGQAINASMQNDPSRALFDLQEAADLCPYETLIWILLGDAYSDLDMPESAERAYEIGGAYGDLAAEDRLRGFRARRLIGEAYFLLEKDEPETIMRIEDKLLARGAPELHWAEYRNLAKKIQRMKSRGSSDLSWALLNNSLQVAMTKGAELHTIYAEQGNQLYREKKYRKAIECYLYAYLEAPDPTPKYIGGNLKKCLTRLEIPAHIDLERFLQLADSAFKESNVAGIESVMENLFQQD